MAAVATSSALRMSAARTAGTTRPLIQATRALHQAVRAKPSQLGALCVHMRSMRLEKRPFHSTAKKQLLPALPQKVDGGVNDPAPVPEPHPMHGSYHWTFERLISAGLIPLTIAPFAAGSLNPMTDAILCTTLLIHSHIGFTALITDYLPSKRVPNIRKLFDWGLRLGTLLVGIGLYEFETNDIGLTETVKKMWKA